MASQVVQRVAGYYTDLAEGQSKLGPEGYARLDSERVHILPVLTKCAARKYWDETVGLVQAMQNYLRLQGFTTDQIMTLEMGLTAAQSTNHRHNESTFLIGLGDSYLHLSQIDKAIDYYEQVLKMVRKNGNRRNEGVALGSLGIAYRELGQVDKAIEHLKQGLAVVREGGYRGREVWILSELGKIYQDVGQIEKAIKYHEQALVTAQAIGDQPSKVIRLNSLGNAYSALQQMDKAIGCYEQALTIAAIRGSLHSSSWSVWEMPSFGWNFSMKR